MVAGRRRGVSGRHSFEDVYQLAFSVELKTSPRFSLNSFPFSPPKAACAAVLSFALEWPTPWSIANSPPAAQRHCALKLHNSSICISGLVPSQRRRQLSSVAASGKGGALAQLPVPTDVPWRWQPRHTPSRARQLPEGPGRARGGTPWPLQRHILSRALSSNAG